MPSDLTAAIRAAKSFDWDAASPRARDAWIAAHIFGLTVVWAEWQPSVVADDWSGAVPHYTTYASADYLVLVRVREILANDTGKLTQVFMFFLPDYDYEPGGWSWSWFQTLRE